MVPLSSTGVSLRRSSLTRYCRPGGCRHKAGRGAWWPCWKWCSCRTPWTSRTFAQAAIWTRAGSKLVVLRTEACCWAEVIVLVAQWTTIWLCLSSHLTAYSLTQRSSSGWTSVIQIWKNNSNKWCPPFLYQVINAKVSLPDSSRSHWHHSLWTGWSILTTPASLVSRGSSPTEANCPRYLHASPLPNLTMCSSNSAPSTQLKPNSEVVSSSGYLTPLPELGSQPAQTNARN
jgi:hypothetical protein